MGGHSSKFPAYMTPNERRWFHTCPKAVLYEIARSFAMQITRTNEYDIGHNLMAEEWKVMYENGLIMDRPCEADGRLE